MRNVVFHSTFMNHNDARSITLDEEAILCLFKRLFIMLYRDSYLTLSHFVFISFIQIAARPIAYE